MSVRSTSQVVLNGIRFEISPVGHFRCLDHGDLWCQHLAELMSTNSDLDPIWYQTDGLGEFRVWIPMFPSRNYWTPVQMIDPALAVTSTSPRLAAAQNLLEVHWKAEAAPNESYVFVGYVRPGEGRNVVRAMLVEYMYGQIDVQNMKCQASTHNFSAERDWQLDMNSTASVIQYWSVFNHGMCNYCLKQFRAALGDPSAVPEDERRGVWT